MFHRGAFSSGVCQGAATQCRRRALGCRGQGVEKQGSGTLKDAPRMCYRKSVSQMQRSICEHGDFLSAEQNGPRGTPPPRLHANPTSPQAMLFAGPLDHTHTHTHTIPARRSAPCPCDPASRSHSMLPFFLHSLVAGACSLSLPRNRHGGLRTSLSKKKKEKRKKKTHTQRQTECPVVPFAVLLITRVWYAAVDRSLSLT